MIDLSQVLKKGVYDTERRHFRAKLTQRKNYLRLDLNENLIQIEPALFADMMARIEQTTVTAYPDLGSIYTRLAEHVGVNEDQIVLTNGSDMGIKSIFDVCIAKGDHLVLHDPYFLMYERYAQFFEAEIDAVPVGADWIPDAATMLAKVNSRTKMVVVEDPSGNIGTGLPSRTLEHMARELEKKNVLLVIDEAYFNVSKNISDNLALVARYSNVILIRTMSKSWGMAGARLGILVTNPALAKELYKVRSLYELNALAAKIAEWHLDNPEVLAGYQQTVRESKAWLFSQLDKMGIAHKDTPANFIIAELNPGNNTERIIDLLKQKGILIGKPYSLPQLRGWARIGVGTLAHGRQLIDALQVILAETKLTA